MIRKFQENDLDTVMQIWFDANVEIHHFIAKDYWAGNYEMVRGLLPQAELYVYEDELQKQTVGFIGLTDDYIAGVFVRADSRSKGVGKQLLDYVKNIKSKLHLSVYEKNVRAIEFYQREGFSVQSEEIEEETNEKEFRMSWREEDV